MSIRIRRTAFTCPACHKGRLKQHLSGSVPLRYFCRACHCDFNASWRFVGDESILEIAKDPRTGQEFELAETAIAEDPCRPSPVEPLEPTEGAISSS